MCIQLSKERLTFLRIASYYCTLSHYEAVCRCRNITAEILSKQKKACYLQICLYMPTILSFKSIDTVTISALEYYMEGYVMMSEVKRVAKKVKMWKIKKIQY